MSTTRPSSLDRPSRAVTVALGLTLGLAPVLFAAAGSGRTVSSEQPSADAYAGDAKRVTIARMMRRVTDLKLDSQPLGDVVAFLREFTGADMEPLWLGDRDPSGLDPQTEITLDVRDATALDVLEMALARADRAAGQVSPSTWQMTRYGSIEFGPRDRLNASKRTEVYVISDFLFDVPDFAEAPEFDLNTIFSQGGQAGGGGGGQAPFQQNQAQRDPIDVEAVAEELADVLRTFAEPEEWVDNGGTGGTLRYYRGTFIVNAPDYMHRAITGYPWWPRAAQRVRAEDGRRSLSISDAGVDTNEMLRRDEAAATAPPIRDVRARD